jgi:Ca-activated chloride channel family protein
MTVHPALPPVLLTILVLSVLGIATAAWYQRRPSRISVLRLAGLTCAAALLVVAAVRPVIGESSRTLPAGVADDEPNVFLVLDRSPDMPTAAHDDAVAVLDRYPRARTAVIGFASTGQLEWPLSQDNWTLRPVLQSMRPYAPTSESRDRTNPAAAAIILRYQLISARQQFPRARNLVFYLGSGARGPDSPPRNFALADDTVDGGAVFGYGDDTTLRAVADQIGVPYVAGGTAALDAVAPTSSAAPPMSATSATETYWIPALLAAALLLVEVFCVLSGIRRSRPRTPWGIP